MSKNKSVKTKLSDEDRKGLKMIRTILASGNRKKSKKKILAFWRQCNAEARLGVKFAYYLIQGRVNKAFALAGQKLPGILQSPMRARSMQKGRVLSTTNDK